MAVSQTKRDIALIMVAGFFTNILLLVLPAVFLYRVTGNTAFFVYHHIAKKVKQAN